MLECLRAGRRSPRKLFVLRNAAGLDELLALKRSAQVIECTRQDLDDLARGQVHQGVILEAGPLPLWTIEEWAERPFAPDAVVAVLDCIEDPHNFGAIVRSACALGAAGVVFTKDRSAPLSSAAMKSAAGAMEYIDLVQATNLARGLDALKQAGFWVAGLDAAGERTIFDADLSGRIALVIGGEGKGMRRLTAERCDFLLNIPIAGPITSLNASVSAAIALAECCRRRAEHHKNG